MKERFKADNPRKYSAYMKRIQERIDHMLDNMVWLANNRPELLKFEERELDDPNIERYMRLKKILDVCVKMNPYSEDPTLFRLLSKMIPTYAIELVRKPSIPPKPMVVYRCLNCSGTYEDIDAKEGDVHELVEKAFSKIMPFSAKASMFGDVFFGYP